MFNNMILNNPNLTATPSPKAALACAQALPEAQWWLPACSLPTPDKPVHSANVLGVDVVLWLTSAGWHAAIDQCSHRGAALSKGCVVNNTLQCPYHGWAFNPRGECVSIPALPDFKPPVGHGLTRIKVCEYGGVLWVQLATNDDKPQPASLFKAHTQHLSQPNMQHTICGPYEVATSAPRVVENFLDISHFGTVHKDWLGDPSHMSLEPYTLHESAQDLHASGCKVWQPKSQAQLDSLHTGAWVDYDYFLAHPYGASLKKHPDTEAGISESIALFVCPVSPTQSVVWFSFVSQADGHDAAAIRAFQDTIFKQDEAVLLTQRPVCLPLEPNAEKHSAADKMSAAYRRLLSQWNITVGTIPRLAA